VSRITDFYSGKLKHPKGFSISDVLGWDYGKLEFEHTYIQWLFPLPERSKAEPDSPILSNGEIKRFAEGEDLRNTLRRSFEMLLGFYGFSLRYIQDAPRLPLVKPSEEFTERAKRWLSANNHNYLRITRILRSLTLLGLAAEAKEFFAALQRVYLTNTEKIGSYTYNYWRNAVGH
jgi:hypothetical protein